MPVSQRVIAAYLSQRLSVGGTAATAPANTVAPVVSGTATVGQTLSTTDGTWTGTAPIVYTYQWQRAGVNIGSATNSTYVLVSADLGAAVRCVVTGTNSAGNASANSNATSAVTQAPVNTVAPAVTGTATVGQTLTSTTGTWTGTATITYGYQWQRAGVNIGGATSSTYVLVDADYTNAIRCVVTATNGIGSASANSNATAAVVRTYAQQVLADSPNQYLKLDEASGTTATDYGSAALNWTYVNSPSLGSTAGPLTAGGTAVTLASASSQSVSRAWAASLNLGDVFTIEFFIKRANLSAYTAIFDSGGTGPPELQINNTGNTIRFLKARTGEICQSSSAIGNDVWTHVCLTKNGATTVIYLNGVSATGSVSNLTCTDAAFTRTLGAEGAGLYLNGSLSQFATYTTALSAGRVAAHYAAK